MTFEGADGRIINVANDEVDKEWIQVTVFCRIGKSESSGFSQNIMRFHKTEWIKILESANMLK